MKDAVVSQVRDIHIESYSPDTVDACERFDIDADAFNCGMMGTVTTVITSDCSARHATKTLESPTIKRNAHRSSMLPQLRKFNLSKGYSADSTDDSVRGKGLRLLDQILSHDQRLLEKSSAANWNKSRNRSPTSSFNSLGRSLDGMTTTAPSEAQTPATSASSTPSMSKDEFDALPPTIQRKYFSTLERLRFAQTPPGSATSIDTFETAPELPQDESTTLDRSQFRPVLKSRSTETALARPRTRASRVFPNPSEQQRALTRDDLAINAKRKSIILDATDEAVINWGKRQPSRRETHKPQSLSTSSSVTIRPGSLYKAASVDHLRRRMHSQTGHEGWLDGRLKATEDSIYDSFRWFDEDDSLDLRLNMEDYHDALRQNSQPKSQASSLRRHLSISSKLTFRQSISLSRPGTNDANGPSFFGGSGSIPSTPSSPTHGRRRSRALSLMSPTKFMVPSQDALASPTNEPVIHYQDPETRLKLRAYLASPHKFDEAVEFGFPSVDKPQDVEEKHPARSDSLAMPHEGGLQIMKTLPEDRRCSIYSDDATTSEPDSPRTPNTLEKPVLPQLLQTEPAPKTANKGDYAQAPAASREMTLRMTLTRPDLRADEEKIYGWQKPKMTATSAVDEPNSPTALKRDGNSKESIERELAAIDLENLLSGDHGPMRRFWNRVRRA